MTSWVRVRMYPIGIVTLLELDDGEGIIAAGVDNSLGYVITANAVPPPVDPHPPKDDAKVVRELLDAAGKPTRTSEFSSQTDD